MARMRMATERTLAASNDPIRTMQGCPQADGTRKKRKVLFPTQQCSRQRPAHSRSLGEAAVRRMMLPCLPELDDLKGDEQRDGDQVGVQDPEGDEQDERVRAPVLVVPLRRTPNPSQPQYNLPPHSWSG